MDAAGFNVGDPVQAIGSSVIGKISRIIECKMLYEGVIAPACIFVRPAGKRYTQVAFQPRELRICRCANRNPNKS